MLLENNYTIVPSIRFTLTYDSGVRKVITVKTRDTIDCSYKKNGERFSIKGVVAKIGCNFNSSLGAVGTTAYLQVDGSSEYSGQVEYIQPTQVLDLTILSTTDIVDNVVCSVDNIDQKITLIRENEVGVFQYSLDGITWRAANGAQGMSAYECAVALGFVGTEAEWLASLKGPKGDTGESGGLEIYKVFSTIAEAEANRDLIPVNKLVVVKLDPAILLVRNNTNAICKFIDNNFNEVTVVGYDYLGYLTVGPKGDKGDKGNDGENGISAYQYAVEAGFTGTEEEFAELLARTSVVVTNYYMGPTSCVLTNTVIGPIDLRIFGYTNQRSFRSKKITKINISSPTEEEDQTLVFPEAIVLRAVPTAREAAKPNVVIKGQKYVADCIMKKDGQVGVYRRIKYIESYNGETILGDWISSTGQLDYGAQVQYTSYGSFEPFDDTVQSQYKKLRAYDLKTQIDTEEGTYLSVSYPIDVKTYIDEYVAAHIQEYLEEHGPAIIRPIVIEELEGKLDAKQDKLTSGDHIFIDDTSKISVTDIGTLPTGKTVAQYIADVNSDLGARINANTTDIDGLKTSKQDKLTAGDHVSIDSANKISVPDIGTLPSGKTAVQYIDEKAAALESSKQAKLTAGENITITSDNVISSSANTTISESFTTTKAVGGIAVGTVIEAGTQVTALLKQMLCPDVPPEENCMYFGTSATVPTSVEGLTKQAIVPATVLTSGIANKFTSTDQKLVCVYSKNLLPEVVSIKDSSGFENIDGWSHTTITVNEVEHYAYYTNDSITISNFKLTFYFTE